MEGADILCDSLFRWLENRKECAGKLLELAQELEDVHRGSNIAQVVGAATTVLSISGALIATVFSGGLATPLLVAATAGTAVSATSTLVEAGMSSSTFNKAIELIKEDEKVGENIQKQLGDLKDRCGEAPLGAHADELDCEVATRLMWALARRRNIPVPLDFLRAFYRATFFRHMTPGGLAPDKAKRFIFQALRAVGFFGVMTCGLKVSAKVMMKNIGRIGIKAVAKAGSKALGVIGVGMCLYDLIVTSEELVKGNRVTEASKFLWDSAGEILDGQRKLKEQLDAMNEIIQKLFQMKNLIKDLGGYSLSMTENGQKIMDYIMGTCTDNRVVSWLQGITHQIVLVNLLQFCQEWLTTHEEDLKKPSGGHVHIVFVAHGRIVEQFMPAGGLVPTPNIRDTVIYSPWNCLIDANVAFAIAQDFIQVTDRKFYNTNNDVYYEPNPLPNHWNSMRGSRHDIPVILLSPVTPEDPAWKCFQQYWMNRGMEIQNRVIIPYFAPQVNVFGEIPLFILIFVASFLLMLSNKTATVHLAACLGRGGTPARPEEWRTQYAYTSDGTLMSVNLDDRNMNTTLFRALRSMFDRNRR
ncbi:hypothetical protein R3I93_007787 [Phoxinus phoxinus]|uniref:Uncharacterized protein n=1 Tax=Phoxinus phoxinus TaxID=58324 RepID=A0AAN9DEG4_9TELE